MDKSEFFERYAAVIVEVGLNLQAGQELYLRAPLEASEFVPHVVRSAYRRKAKYVHVEYRDLASTRARLEEAPEETLTFVPGGLIQERLRVGKEGGASLSILGEDPMGLAGVDPARRGPAVKAMAEATAEVRSLSMSDFFNWCVVSTPNQVWADRVYPQLAPEAALEELFHAVAHACRLDTGDPVAEWRSHSRRLMKLAGWLTDQQFDRFEYAAPGTELSLGMPEGHAWIGTEGVTAGGTTFIANIPTDEVFCAPDWRRVDGRVRSTRPIIMGGTNLGTVDFEVEGGRITRATAEREQQVLDQELDLDDRARYLGEIALVTEDAPIAEMKTTFFDGLYDENAGCHLAFGNAYAACVDGGKTFSEDERLKAGLNVSHQHADFTVGSGELVITAVRKNGERFPLMDAGRWTKEVEAEAGI